MSAICLFWTLMLVRAWEKRYEASFAMAEARGNDMMDAGKGEESNEVIQFKIDHMIHQGQDSLETFRAVVIPTERVMMMMTVWGLRSRSSPLQHRRRALVIRTCQCTIIE